MKSFSKAAAAAILVACLSSAGPAAAERAAMTARIGVGDLDLATPAGLRTFDQRVRVATEIACGDASKVADMASDLKRCRAEMRNDAAAQLAGRVADPAKRSRVTVAPESAGQ
jgi:UrcA family protein